MGGGGGGRCFLYLKTSVSSYSFCTKREKRQRNCKSAVNIFIYLSVYLIKNKPTGPHEEDFGIGKIGNKRD